MSGSAGLPQGVSAILCEAPWGETLPDFSLWITDGADLPGRAVLALRYLDGAGDTIHSRDLWRSGTYDGIRLWYQATVSHRSFRPPSGTQRLQLVCEASEGPARVLVSDLRTHLPPPPSPPPGIERIGLVSTDVIGALFDPDGRRIILASGSLGVGAFEIESAKLQRWIPYGKPVPEGGISCDWLALGSDRVFLRTSQGELRGFDLGGGRDGAVISPVRNGGPPRHGDARAASGDGRFLAVVGFMAGFELFHIADDGTVTHRHFTSGRVGRLEFVEDDRRLLAHDGSRIWSLPIDRWRDADPDMLPVRAHDPEDVRAIDPGTTWDVNGTTWRFHQAASAEIGVRRTGASGLLTLPRGRLFRESPEVLWFVSPRGGIYRIDLTKAAPGPEVER